MKTIIVKLNTTVSRSVRRIPRSLCLALLVLLGLGSRQAQAAIAVVDSTGSIATNTVLPISQVFPTTGGNVLVVNLSYKGPNGVYPTGPLTLDWVTSGGAVTQTMTRAVQRGNNATKANGSSIYYLWNPIADAGGTISGSLPASYTAQIISAITLSGVDTNVVPIIADGDNANSQSFLSVTTTNVLAGGPLGGFAALASGCANNTSGTGFSARASGGTPVNWSVSTGGSYWYQGYIPNLVATTTNFTCAYLGANNRMHIVAAVFTPATSTSPTPTVIGQNATDRTTTSATLGAIVITNGGATIDDYGVVYAATAVNPAPAVGGTGVSKLQKGTTETLGAFTVSATSLTPGTLYSYAGYAHNASGYGYSDVGTFYALTNEPTVQATGVSFSSAQRSAFTFSWTRGNGDNCIVLVKAGAAGTTDPVDGTTYSASATFGSGSLIGTGSYVAYIGTGNSVTLSNMTIGTTYYVAVYELNGAGGPENYLTSSPATGNQTAVLNTYYSVNTGISPSSTTSWTNSLGANPANFTTGDTFIIQSGHSLSPPGSWTLSGGATLIINSGGTLDMQYNLNKLFLGGSFVNNGTFLNSEGIATVNFINFGNVNQSTNFTSTLRVGTNYNVSVLAIGGGGGGASANNPSNSLPVQGGGGGGGASAYSTNLVLQAGNAYQVTVGANGIRATIGTGFGSAGAAGGASSFGGGFLTTVIANGGAGGAAGDTNGVVPGGAAGAAGSSGNAANFAGGDATIGGGGGGGGADDVAVGNAASGGAGGSAGAGSLAAGGAGASVTANTAGVAGSGPGGGGSGGNWTSGAGKAGGAGGVGWVTVAFLSTNTSPQTFSYDFRSRASGDWNDFNTWSVDTGSGFVNAVSGETPNSGHNSVVIQSPHTVTVSSAAVTVNLTVNTGGTLTVNGGNLAVNRLSGQAAANNLTVNGTLNLASAGALSLGNNTTNLIAAGAVLNHTGAANVVVNGTGIQTTISGTYNQNVTGSGVIPVAIWGAGSTCQINSTFTNNVTGNVQLNYGQTFGNFIWNAQGGTTNIIYRMANGAITNWTLNGNLTIQNTAGTPARLELTGTQPLSVSIQNLTMTGGNFRAGGGGSALTVNGPIAISAGTFDTGGSINALGDVSITGTAAVTGGVDFRFAKAGAQAWTTTAPNTLTGPAWIVNSGTALALGSASTCVVNDLTVNGSLAVTGNSTLLVNGSNVPSTNNSGTITVASGSTLGGGGAIGASVTLSAGASATNTVAFGTNGPNGELTLTNGLALNGNTIYVSTGTNVLSAGNYVLITNTSGGITGSFASVVISGAGLAPNTTGNLVTTANAVTLQVISTVVSPPAITSTVLSGSDLVISGTNTTGTAGGTYYVRASTNVAVPMASWPRISTNTYGVGGAFSVTNQILPGVPVNFYRIEQ